MSIRIGSRTSMCVGFFHITSVLLIPIFNGYIRLMMGVLFIGTFFRKNNNFFLFFFSFGHFFGFSNLINEWDVYIEAYG